MRIVRLLGASLSFVGYLNCAPIEQEELPPPPSFERAEQIVADGAEQCRAAVGDGFTAAIDSALEQYWDEITGSAYYPLAGTDATAPAETGVNQWFLLSNESMHVLVRPDRVQISVKDKDLELVWDGFSVSAQNGKASVEWSSSEEVGFAFGTATAISQWSCTSKLAGAKAQAYTKDSFWTAEDSSGVTFDFEGRVSDATSAIGLTDYFDRYHIGFCEPDGCASDRGTYSTVQRLVNETIGWNANPDEADVAFRGVRGEGIVPQKAVELFRLVNELETYPPGE